MKARVVRYLVEDLGFRAVAWETAWRESRVAAEYVAGCAGSPEDAMRSMYAVWWDVSVRDLLRWMCQYDQAHPTDPVVLYGFDVQEPWRSIPALRSFVARAAPAEDSLLVPLADCVGASVASLPDFYRSAEFQDLIADRRDPALHPRCIGGIDALEAWIDANAASLATATSARDVEEARLDLVAVRGWEDQLLVDWPQGYHAREIAMATMVRRLRDHYAPGARTIVWAWNWHIARDYARAHGNQQDPAFTDDRQGVAGMGSYLHEWYGESYVPIALTGYRIFRPPGVTPPPLPTSDLVVEKRLHDLGRDWLLVDLRQPIPGPLLPRTRDYGIAEMWADPYAQFDALIHLEQVPAQIIP